MLASIQKIISVEPIPGADKIEKVKILGWDCVVKKGEFKPGDLCVYIETDSIIPKYLLTDNPEDKDEIRLKTIKLKGQLSQGLVLNIYILNKYLSHLDIFEDYVNFTDEGGEWLILKIGSDITDILGIKKYEKEIPAQLQGAMKGNFPNFISKTDEVRVQAEPKLIESLIGKPYYISVKIDGTSSTFYKYNGEFGACSRNIDMKPGESIYWRIAQKYNLEELLPEGIVIQGEIAGPGIQQNKLGLEDFKLFIFNVYSIVDKEYFSFYDLITFCKWKGLEVVPILESNYSFNYTIEQLIDMSNNLKYPNGKNAEGIVVRSWDKSVSFKVISNTFLLKNGE